MADQLKNCSNEKLFKIYDEYQEDALFSIRFGDFDVLHEDMKVLKTIESILRERKAI